MHNSDTPGRVRVHGDQRGRVADAVLYDSSHHVSRRHPGRTAAQTVRAAVQGAVLEALRRQGVTHEQAAEAGAMAADRAMAELGVRLNPVGEDRQGWRGVLADIERLAADAIDAFDVAPGSDWKTRGMTDLKGIQEYTVSLIDGVHE